MFLRIRGADRVHRKDQHSGCQYPRACSAQERFSHDGALWICQLIILTRISFGEYKLGTVTHNDICGSRSLTTT